MESPVSKDIEDAGQRISLPKLKKSLEENKTEAKGVKAKIISKVVDRAVHIGLEQLIEDLDETQLKSSSKIVDFKLSSSNDKTEFAAHIMTSVGLK